MNSSNYDHLVRMQVFDFLGELADRYGDVLPLDPLRQGINFHGHRVPLLGPQGIFKPKILDLPISITTAPNSPYDDSFTEDNLVRYRYRGTDPHHRDNVGLRALMMERKPLVYFHGIVPGRYVATWPAFVVGDDPKGLAVTIAVDDRAALSEHVVLGAYDDDANSRRRYVTAAVKVRLHQRLFRERVLAAYRDQCALCRLRHTSLLEAAHITPDSSPDGEPVVKNGVSLCKLHHAAFDQNILGIRPDYVVEIRKDILEEIDGPMLRFGLQQMHGQKIIIPRRADFRPDKIALEGRYQAFREA
ncbi:HNH endonuclease [Marinobacter salarius]|uniref:HNH endonuclease n=2 Tax=Marinobacter salarius TaxID=1420917 RepID=UPI001D1832F3|nr:HNH endonuclease [Marinobacter salarius]MCC4283175.1 HNH endonuclease [Marinobacter salarius]